MAANPDTGQAVVFGGMARSGHEPFRGDTWIWNGSGWAAYVGEVAPSARWGAAMGFDPVSKRLILYGGSEYDGSSGGTQTWAWNGSTWQQLSPRNNPRWRAEPLMAVDPSRGRLLLFGGLGGPNAQLCDTWQWEGDDWTKLLVADAPFCGTGGGLAFDPLSGRMMLAGFRGGAPDDRRVWFLERDKWVAQTFANTGMPRDGFILLPDDRTGRVLLIGGPAGVNTPQGPGMSEAIWSWDGQDWVAANPSGRPAARWRAAAAATGRGQVLIFGGEASDQYQNHYPLDDTWTWERGSWTQRTLVTTHGQVEAVFVVGVVTATLPGPADIFEVRLTEPDGSAHVKQLCVRHAEMTCARGTNEMVWRFDPVLHGSAHATYQVVRRNGGATVVLAEGTVDLLHSRTYFADYKG